MSYNPMYDAARKAMDETLGKGEYARLNVNNPVVPPELRKKLKAELALLKRRKKAVAS
jgi:hypothetical protein